MKVCKKCGAIQDNNHINCIDCGEHLGSPLTKEDEAKVDQEVSKSITNLSNRTDYFYVRKRDKVIAILLAIGALIFIILFIRIKEDYRPILLSGVVAMAIRALDIWFPWFSWEIAKIHYSFTIANSDDLQPTELSLIIRRLISYGMLIVGYAAIIYLMIYLYTK